MTLVSKNHCLLNEVFDIDNLEDNYRIRNQHNLVKH